MTAEAVSDPLRMMRKEPGPSEDVDSASPPPVSIELGRSRKPWGIHPRSRGYLLVFPEFLGLSPQFLDYGGRLLIATIMGGVIGIEREAKDRPAGLRTHMMTSLAAALFTVLTLELHAEFNLRDPNTSTDPIRIIEAVTSGVAFLAAGAIIQGRGKVQGLTTGAGMWLSGAVGVACGAERYGLAIIALVLATIILALLRPLERFLPGNGSSQRDKSEAKATPSDT
jgi:putative Mg2+ transporter-C (MgtC) family protein